MKSIGVDIIEIDRVEKIISEFGDNFLKKVYTDEEIKYCKSKAKPSQHFAARFAAKEAVAKAMGTGFGKDLMLKDVEVRNDINGKPIVYYKGIRNDKVLISISHCDHYVVAFAALKD
ncbi:MAG: holo-ACP synthase [Ignavibacteria bacterium]|jgi:holo-[acyl-carrier protein] synthase|nr:holo-ACP synthase [Ignavibacteria bacterium]MDH7528143.1 holo-ACP synthase [Ignavibacteria bacterium]NPV10352.1 holo-ACP synthase [Ignavibacteria bacterium]